MSSEGAVPVTGVCELVLEQNDLVAAEHFYADVLGFPVVERWHRNGEAVWVMAGDRTRIGLWRPQIGLGGGRGLGRCRPLGRAGLRRVPRLELILWGWVSSERK